MNVVSHNHVQLHEPVAEPQGGLPSFGRRGMSIALASAAIGTFTGSGLAEADVYGSQHIPTGHHLVMERVPSQGTLHDLLQQATQHKPQNPQISELSSAEVKSKTADQTEAKGWFDELDDKEKVELVINCLTGLALLGSLAVAGKHYRKSKTDQEGSEDKGTKIKRGTTLFLGGKFSDLIVAAGTASAIDIAVQLSNAGGLAEGVLVSGGLVFLGAAEPGSDFDDSEKFEAAVLNKIPASLAGMFAGLAEAGLHPGVEFGFAPLIIGGLSYGTLKAFNKHRIGSRRANKEAFESTFDFKMPALQSVLRLLRSASFHENADALRMALMDHDEAGILLEKGQDELEPNKQGPLANAYDRVITRERRIHDERQSLISIKAQNEGKSYELQEFDGSKTKKKFENLETSIRKLIEIRTGDRNPDDGWSPTAVLVADTHKSQGKHSKMPGPREMNQ